MQEYINMWKNYFNFSDRTTRRGFWMAFLCNILVSFVFSGVCSFLFRSHIIFGAILFNIYSLVLLVPSLAIVVRRLRDAGKHWGYIFISLVPLIGGIMLLIFLCSNSVPNEDNVPVV